VAAWVAWSTIRLVAGSRQGSLLVGAGMVAGAFMGIVEGVVYGVGGAVGRAAAVVLSVGLWVLFALLVSNGARLLMALAVAPPSEARVRGAWRAAVLRLRNGAADPADDARTLGRMLGGAAALVAFVGGIAALAYGVVTTAHDPALSALAIGGGALIAGGLALVLGMATARAARALASRTGGRLRALHAAAGLGLAGAVCIAVVALRHRELLVLAGGVPWVAFVAMAIVQGALWLRVPEHARWAPAPRGWMQGVGGLVAFGLVLAGNALPDARVAVARHEGLSAHLFHWLTRASDFDRDGVGTPPFGTDCAPFDPEVHPMAREIPGNGRDDNCDGRDGDPNARAGLPAVSASLGLDVTPDLLLITLDATRADHMGFLGYGRPTTPRLDALVRGGAVFTRAYSQDSGTAPSMWSLMAGKTPFQARLTRAHRFPPALADTEQTLAEALRQGGYRTEAILCGSMFEADNWNLRRGFDAYRDVCAGRVKAGLARHVLAEAAPAVERLRAGKAPSFLWLHFLDPHAPYHDHADLDFGPRPMDRYDEELRYVEGHVADVVKSARAATSTRPLYVALTADHGENFGDHGPSRHARTLYREVTHVPLVIWGPGVRPRRIDAPVAVGDLHPTLLQLAGEPVRPEVTMQSLVPILLGGPADPDRAVFMENSYSRPRRHVKGIVKGRHHLIRDLTRNTVEMYDVIADPGERHDLAGRGLPEERALLDALEELLRTTEVPREIR
jgi:arylsulfatase A-like enzyme